MPLQWGIPKLPPHSLLTVAYFNDLQHVFRVYSKVPVRVCWNGYPTLIEERSIFAASTSASTSSHSNTLFLLPGSDLTSYLLYLTPSVYRYIHHSLSHKHTHTTLQTFTQLWKSYCTRQFQPHLLFTVSSIHNHSFIIYLHFLWIFLFSFLHPYIFFR